MEQAITPTGECPDCGEDLYGDEIETHVCDPTSQWCSTPNCDNEIGDDEAAELGICNHCLNVYEHVKWLMAEAHPDESDLPYMTVTLNDLTTLFRPEELIQVNIGRIAELMSDIITDMPWWQDAKYNAALRYREEEGWDSYFGATTRDDTEYDYEVEGSEETLEQRIARLSDGHHMGELRLALAEQGRIWDEETWSKEDQT